MLKSSFNLNYLEKLCNRGQSIVEQKNQCSTIASEISTV